MDTEILEMPSPVKKKAGRPKKIVVNTLPEFPEDEAGVTIIDTTKKVVKKVDHGNPPPPVKPRSGGDDKPRGGNNNINFMMMGIGVLGIAIGSWRWKEDKSISSVLLVSIGTFYFLHFGFQLKTPLFGETDY